MLHSFRSGTDGALPVAGLIYVTGMFYGTTVIGGGPCHCGTVFRISATGDERVLYKFPGGAEGANPAASLIEFHGTLYGTTAGGGTTGSPFGNGTVFSISPIGTGYHTLYRFGNGVDGADPQASLLGLDGTFYGTATGGGIHPKSPLGTVFSLSPSGQILLLHTFGLHIDGAQPYANLINVGGVLYGTTFDDGGYGAGIVYSITL